MIDDYDTISIDLNEVNWDAGKFRSLLLNILRDHTDYKERVQIDVLSRSGLQGICYFCDTYHYANYYSSITGCIYVRVKNKPVPIFFDAVMKQMITDGYVNEDGTDRYKVGDAVHSNLPPKTCYSYSNLSDDEKETISFVLQRYLFDKNKFDSDMKSDISCSIPREGQAIDFGHFPYNDFVPDEVDEDES